MNFFTRLADEYQRVLMVLHSNNSDFQSLDHDEPLPSSVLVVHCAALRVNCLSHIKANDAQHSTSSRSSDATPNRDAPFQADERFQQSPFLVLDLQDVSVVNNSFDRNRHLAVAVMSAALTSMAPLRANGRSWLRATAFSGPRSLSRVRVFK